MKNLLTSFLLFGGFAFTLLNHQAASQILLNSLASTDLTLISGSDGEAVVDATLLKIDSITAPAGTLRNDFNFLKRIALVESNFAVATSQLPNGGLWQINSHVTNTITNVSLSSKVQDLLDAFEQNFGSDVIDFSNSDFSVPLNSAVAARIFVETVLSSGGLGSSDSFPATIEEQGQWWATNYRNSIQNSSDFISAVEAQEEVVKCKVTKLDLWFLIDGSGSVTFTNFRTSLDFVSQTAAQFDIHPDRVRTGLMIYSTNTHLRSLFNQHQSNKEFDDVITSTPYPSAGTNTGRAIDVTSSIGFNENNGMRPNTEGVPRVLVVLTDGRSYDSVVDPSENIKERGITVYGVGVGSGYNEVEVEEIASDPDATYSYGLSGFSDLISVLQAAIRDQACSVPALIPEGANMTVSIPNNTVSYLVTLVYPPDRSMRICVDTQPTTSVGTGYLSETIPNPGSVVNDASFQIESGKTDVVYNLQEQGESQRKKRQITSGDEPLHMFIAIENTGTEPIDLQLRTTKSAEAFVPLPPPAEQQESKCDY